MHDGAARGDPRALLLRTPEVVVVEGDLDDPRLRFDVDVLENVEVVIEFQDVRDWGEEGATTVPPDY
ncbi:MAG: hypothetical protein ACYTFD_01385 [Planctomycetota bacterium]|jgi:hypothetical protein